MRNILALLAAIILGVASRAAAPLVQIERLPEGAIQPQIIQASDGTVHLIYYKGAAGGGDLFYVTKTPGQTEFSKPTRVNSQPGSAIAAGSIRGAHIALGRNGRIHAAWMGGSGSVKAKIEGEENTPMAYTRLAEDGKSFEPERNVLTFTGRLDGGGTVAADPKGNVYVAWHGAPPSSPQGEIERAVYVARSSDDGKTFAREIRASPDASGACGCCGMGAFADSNGALYLLYRAATQMTNRDEVLLVSKDAGKNFKVENSDRWVSGICPMSSTALGEVAGETLAAWENAGKINLVRTSEVATTTPKTFTPAGDVRRKHPALATNSKGLVLVAWTEGTAWQKGGSAGWQVFDAQGKPVSEQGSAPGVPVWGLVAAYAKPDGSFVVLF